jgi:hypothetical protein
VAVGVLDVLPVCASSVYFFWDPALSKLALGRVSALREIAWAAAAAAREARRGLHWHYLGYYIQACPKVGRALAATCSLCSLYRPGRVHDRNGNVSQRSMHACM